MQFLVPKRIPSIVKKLYPTWYTWDKPIPKKKVLYLTFDDGPIPQVTPWVLSLLSRKQIPATFFCIGDNVRKHPEILQQIKIHNHAIGNHTFNHLNGCRTANAHYVKNTQKAEIALSKATATAIKSTPNFALFRPPYGKIKRSQATTLRKLGFEVIMYRTIAFDWNAKTPKECYQNIIKNAQSGDIIVLHDSLKAETNLRYTLPKVIDYYLDQGFEFKKL